MSGLGDPVGYAYVLDAQIGPPAPALVAELDQIVTHWRAAGWSDLAIGATLAGARPRLVQACRTVT